MRRSACLIPCVLVIACTSWGGGRKAPAAWENLSSLQPGEKIQVVDATQKKHAGTFSSVTNSAIVVHERSGDETIQRENVLRVTAGNHRVRNAVIGGAVGAGVGAGIGAATYSSCAPSQSFCLNTIGRGGTAAIGAVVGTGLGAVVGAILPAHKTIYRTP